MHPQHEHLFVSVMEPLEARQLFSTTVPTPSATYSGTAAPSGKAAQNAYANISGVKSEAKKVPATLILNVANGIASGSLNLQNVATYPIGGTVTGQHVSLTLSSSGTIVGTITARLDPRDKHVTG